jgi:uncharacterized protein (TIGR02452 family)
VRDADGNLLEEPLSCSFVTIPAPNRSSLKKEEYESWKEQMDQTLFHRTFRALAIFSEQDCRHLVLGAFGCGVFVNQPEEVAEIFDQLFKDEFRGKFESVVFAILVVSKKDENNIEAFTARFGKEAWKIAVLKSFAN